MKYTIFILTATIVLFVSCKKDKTTPKVCVDDISYANDVVPILMNSCATTGCHTTEANANGMNFTNYEGVFEHRVRIVEAIRSENGATPMPLGTDPLNSEQISTISCWIEQGALNN